MQLLQKSTGAMGVNKLLKVMAKDNINVQVDYYYPLQSLENGSANGVSTLTSMLSTFLDGSKAPSAIKGNGNIVSTQLNNDGNLSSLLYPESSGSGGTTPKAYLNILFFDEQFKFINQSSRIIPVSVADSRQQIVQSGIEAPKNGYMYAYVSNESNNLVYFDNFVISHTRGPILEETHYYPFGLTMAGISSKAYGGTENKKKYNGIEFDNDLDVNEYEADLRNLDPQVGRWW